MNLLGLLFWAEAIGLVAMALGLSWARGEKLPYNNCSPNLFLPIYGRKGLSLREIGPNLTSLGVPLYGWKL